MEVSAVFRSGRWKFKLRSLTTSNSPSPSLYPGPPRGSNNLQPHCRLVSRSSRMCWAAPYSSHPTGVFLSISFSPHSPQSCTTSCLRKLSRHDFILDIHRSLLEGEYGSHTHTTTFTFQKLATYMKFKDLKLSKSIAVVYQVAKSER